MQAGRSRKDMETLVTISSRFSLACQRHFWHCAGDRPGLTFFCEAVPASTFTFVRIIHQADWSGKYGNRDRTDRRATPPNLWRLWIGNFEHLLGYSVRDYCDCIRLRDARHHGLIGQSFRDGLVVLVLKLIDRWQRRGSSTPLYHDCALRRPTGDMVATGARR